LLQTFKATNAISTKQLGKALFWKYIAAWKPLSRWQICWLQNCRKSHGGVCTLSSGVVI